MIAIAAAPSPPPIHDGMMACAYTEIYDHNADAGASQKIGSTKLRRALTPCLEFRTEETEREGESTGSSLIVARWRLRRLRGGGRGVGGGGFRVEDGGEEAAGAGDETREPPARRRRRGIARGGGGFHWRVEARRGAVLDCLVAVAVPKWGKF